MLLESILVQKSRALGVGKQNRGKRGSKPDLHPPPQRPVVVLVSQT